MFKLYNSGSYRKNVYHDQSLLNRVSELLVISQQSYSLIKLKASYLYKFLNHFKDKETDYLTIQQMKGSFNFYTTTSAGNVFYNNSLPLTPEVWIMDESPLLYMSVESLDKYQPVVLLDYPCSDLAGYMLYTQLQESHRTPVIFYLDPKGLIRKYQQWIKQGDNDSVSKFLNTQILPGLLIQQLNFGFVNRLYQSSDNEPIDDLNLRYHPTKVPSLSIMTDRKIASLLPYYRDRYQKVEELMTNIPMFNGNYQSLLTFPELPQTKIVKTLHFLVLSRHLVFLTKFISDSNFTNKFLLEYEFMVKNRYFNAIPDYLYEYYKIEYIDTVVRQLKKGGTL